jgi:hypothetical protein
LISGINAPFTLDIHLIPDLGKQEEFGNGIFGYSDKN